MSSEARPENPGKEAEVETAQMTSRQNRFWEQVRGLLNGNRIIIELTTAFGDLFARINPDENQGDNKRPRAKGAFKIVKIDSRTVLDCHFYLAKSEDWRDFHAALLDLFREIELQPEVRGDAICLEGREGDWGIIKEVVVEGWGAVEHHIHIA